MTWENHSETDSTWNPRESSGLLRVGDLPTDYFTGLAYDDVVPGSGGKTLGELTFLDTIRAIVWTLMAETAAIFSTISASAVAWSNGSRTSGMWDNEPRS